MAAAATAHTRIGTSQSTAQNSAGASAWLPIFVGSAARTRPDAKLDADFQLVDQCLSGQEAAWEELVRIHSRRVYTVCYRFTGKESEAQDLTQEVFLRVFKTLKSFRSGEGAFATWLARLSANLLVDTF